MIEMRISGNSVEEIAKFFKVSTSTVHYRIQMAKREGMLTDATNKILSILGKAAEVYQKVLEDYDKDPKLAKDAAKDLAFGTGILSTNNRAMVNPQGKAEMTLRAWREKRFATKPTDSSEGTEEDSLLLAPPQPPSEVLEGSFTTFGEIGLPGPEPPTNLEGDEDEI